MSDEETWERRWIKAVKTIAEREEVIDILKAERDNLEANMRARPTGTRSQREAQLEKEVERLRGELQEARRHAAADAESIFNAESNRNDWRERAIELTKERDRDAARATALEAQVKGLTKDH